MESNSTERCLAVDPGDQFQYAFPLRDRELHFSPPKANETRALTVPSAQNALTSIVHSVGDSSMFRMANLESGTGSPGVEIHASLFAVGDTVEIWIDSSSAYDAEALISIQEKALKIVIPRVIALWGVPFYLGSTDGTIAILASSKLNEGGVAVGFFNPADFYPFVDDPKSDAYNPTSNDRMIVYCGIPEDDTGRAGYSLDSIVATIGHELQHLIAYSRTTYMQWCRGDPDPYREESWLSEACAHLTESLCGFGETGGNQVFVAAYALAPWNYSLGSRDLNGADDSVGKRGGAAALLYRLFEQCGGVCFAGLDLVDNGGGAFLKALLSTRNTGWEKLSEILTAEPKAILEAWASDIALTEDGYVQPPVIDTLTGQRVDLDLFVGSVRAPLGKVIDITGPKRLDFEAAPVEIAPLGIAWGKELLLQDRTTLTVECTASTEKGSLLLAMPGR